MSSPAVTIIQDWPAVMGRTEASAYLGISETQLANLTRTYPDRLRTFNLLPGGDVKWSRETLDAYTRWREKLGYERRQA